VRYFLTGGSDNHDVRSGKADEVAGCIRTCVYGAADDSVEAFFEALRAGRSFVTSGPTIVANPAPGSSVRSQDLAKGVEVQVWAPLGLKSVRFESNVPLPQPTVRTGAVHATITLAALPKTAVWFSIRVEDTAGHLAVTNPIWVLGSTPTDQPSTKQ